MRKVFDRYRVDEEARREILSLAVQEAAYRVQSQEEREERVLRSVERRSAAWRRQEDAKEDSAEAPNGGNGDPGR